MNETKSEGLCSCGSGLPFRRCHGSVMNNAGDIPLGKGDPNAPEERVSLVGFPGTYQTLHMMYRFKGNDPRNALPPAAMFNPDTGRLDAERIAREFNVPVATIAAAIRRKAAIVGKSPDASGFQGELRRVYRIWVALVALFAGDKTNIRIFLNAPNRNLENDAPIEFLRSGNLGPLELFVDAMSVRQPT